MNSLTYSAEAYEAAGKLTKPAWCAITGLGFAAQLILVGSSPLGIIHLVFTIASLVYLADVRPALAEVTSAAARSRSGEVAVEGDERVLGLEPGGADLLQRHRGVERPRGERVALGEHPLGVRRGAGARDVGRRCDRSARRPPARSRATTSRRRRWRRCRCRSGARWSSRWRVARDELVGEGQPADLVVDDAGRDALLGERRAWCGRSSCPRRSPTRCARGSGAARARPRGRRRPWTGRRRPSGESGSSSVWPGSRAAVPSKTYSDEKCTSVKPCVAGEAAPGSRGRWRWRPRRRTRPSVVSAASTAV